jgi:hypothetical protein
VSDDRGYGGCGVDKMQKDFCSILMSGPENTEAKTLASHLLLNAYFLLSMTKTDFGSGHFPQCWRSSSMRSSKSECMQAVSGIRWNLDTWTGPVPTGDQPVRLKPGREIFSINVCMYIKKGRPEINQDHLL